MLNIVNSNIKATQGWLLFNPFRSFIVSIDLESEDNNSKDMKADSVMMMYINRYIKEDSMAVWLMADIPISMNPICPIAE